MRRPSTSSSSAAAPAAARWRTRWRRPARASCSSSAATSSRRKTRTGDPAAVWKELRYRTTETWLDERGDAFRPYTHYNVGGNTKFWGSVLYRLRPRGLRGAAARRRRLAGLADRLRHARAVLRPRRAAVPGARRSRRRPDRGRRAGRTHFRRCRTRRAWRRSSSELRRQGLHPSPLPLGLLRRRSRRLLSATPATRSPARFTRRATRKSARSARRSPARTSTLWTNATRAAADHRRDRARASRPSRSSATATIETRVGAAGRSCRAARSTRRRCCCARPPTAHPSGLANSSGLVGRRYMAHLATMMQGFHPFRANDDRVPEDGGDQRLLPGRAATRRIPLGQIQSQGRTHGVMAQTVGAAGFRCGRTTRGSRAASTGWRCRRTCRDPDNRVTRRTRRPHSSSTTGRTTSRAHEQLVDETQARSCSELGFWKVMTHSHKAQEHDAPVRHAGVRHRSARRRCSIRSAAPTTSTTCSSSTRRSSRRRRRSIPG